MLIVVAANVTMYLNTKVWDGEQRARQIEPDMCTNLQTQKLKTIFLSC